MRNRPQQFADYFALNTTELWGKVGIGEVKLMIVMRGIGSKTTEAEF